MSVSNNIARYEARTKELDRAMVAESARWGDFYRPAQPYRREAEWLGTNRWMREVFFPSNHVIALKRFRDAKLFPSVSAPTLSQLGGAVPSGYLLTLNNPKQTGTIYFSTAGVDPRQRGGSLDPAAQAYSHPIRLHTPALVRARVLTSNQWSALAEATFDLQE